MSAKRVLLTGATGFVGRKSIQPLIDRGFEVHAVGRRRPHALPSYVAFHAADLLDLGMHRSLLETVRPTHLLHAAWYAEHGKFWEAVENVHWLKATISLVESFCQAGGHRAVGVGTCAEYDWKYGVMVERESAERPASLYGSSKLAAGTHSGALAAAHGVGFAWARIFFPYGPGEPKSRLVPHVVTSLLRGEEAQCTHGSQFRDFLYVDDVAEALAAVLESSVTGPINIGSGVPLAIRDVVLRIGEMLGREDLIKLGALTEYGDSARMVLASNRRLLEEARWSPRYSLDEGLFQTIDWWQNAARKSL